MGGEVCGALHGSEDDVVEDEDAGGFADAFCDGWVERAAVDEQEAEDVGRDEGVGDEIGVCGRGGAVILGGGVGIERGGHVVIVLALTQWWRH